MPLSKPVPRQHIHSRHLHCRGYHRDDGLWDIEASLIDTKTYSFDNLDRGCVNSGEPIHQMGLRLTIDDEMVVRDAEAAIDAAPFGVCAKIVSTFEALKGLRIAPGWRQAVASRVGGVKGCTHLTDLLVGPLTVVANLTVRDTRTRRRAPAAVGDKPPHLDTCHALASDSPVVKREWPDFYEGD